MRFRINTICWKSRWYPVLSTKSHCLHLLKWHLRAAVRRTEQVLVTDRPWKRNERSDRKWKRLDCWLWTCFIPKSHTLAGKSKGFAGREGNKKSGRTFSEMYSDTFARPVMSESNLINFCWTLFLWISKSADEQLFSVGMTTFARRLRKVKTSEKQSSTLLLAMLHKNSPRLHC